MIYDQNELQSAIEEGERKLAVRRQMRRQQAKRLVFVAALLGVLVPVAILTALMSRFAPPAPLATVTWPKPKIRQVLAPGQTVLTRAGQPFSVEVTNPENWDVKWSAAGIESGGSELSWAPGAAGGDLVATCRARAAGWQSLFAWTWPRRKVSLRAVAPRKIGDYGRAVEADTGVWVYPHIFAKGKVSFDERALQFLSLATQDLPQTALASQLAPVSEKPTPQNWDIVADFEGAAPKTFRDPRQNGTFASLRAGDIETLLPKIAGQIAQQAPDASVKFVIRMDKKPPQGTLRLAFDGKGERKAWVRRAGESAGGPLTGWESGAQKPGLPPSLPAN